MTGCMEGMLVPGMGSRETIPEAERVPKGFLLVGSTQVGWEPSPQTMQVKGLDSLQLGALGSK